ncbi:MAG: hypothetical protein ACLP1X_07610 [Polyangiaceae bacterium]
MSPAPSVVTTVIVRGQVMSAPDTGLGGAQVSWLPGDPYLMPMQKTQADASGFFALGGVQANARDWFVLEQTGFQGVFQEFDVTTAAQQILPAATLPSNADAAALAQTFAVALDPTRVVIRIPIAVSPLPGSTPVAIAVTAQPPLDVPVQYASGEAIVFNAIPVDPYQITVTRGSSTCAPASYPASVAADGSVEVRTLSGFWTVGPAMVCP